MLLFWKFRELFQAISQLLDSLCIKSVYFLRESELSIAKRL
ncbi:unnamed protein product [Tenebrio molitor]|nr:unnamed protein product [Tenebrio molitor]